MATIGFIGTGNIGMPMARHIIEAGHDLIVHDRNPAACEPLLELGAKAAESAGEVAEACRMVFLSLPGPAEVESVLSSPDGILAGATAGDIVVDLSTSSVAAARRMAALAATRGVHYLDSPVTGGVAGAEAGTLAI
jgi:3-hydroxyisobutyrate dehydrogenase-like beta-hydroxyacid dehydrogenase